MTRNGTLTVQTGETSGLGLGQHRQPDTGGGIPRAQISHIFEPFLPTKKKGTRPGLLMIVQRIVRQHGGRIAVDSDVGQGTTFRVSLPLQEREPKLLGASKTESDTAQLRKNAARVGMKSAVTDKPRLLIVDDEKAT